MRDCGVMHLQKPIHAFCDPTAPAIRTRHRCRDSQRANADLTSLAISVNKVPRQPGAS